MTSHPAPTTSRSASLYERALGILPGGVSRNTVLRAPHPIYVDYGKGCRVVDIEGVERIDFTNNMASLIHGHAHPAIVEAVSAQLARGSAFAQATEVEVRYAEHIHGRNPGFEKLRFVNSGTEAVMGAIKAARAFTGRPRIAKVEGSYHGLYDYAEVSQTAGPSNWGAAEKPHSVPVSHGTPQGALDDVVVIPFDDPERAVAILDAHRDEIACVLLDPIPHRVGLFPVSPATVAALRAWTRDAGALLVFDEVITFRTEVGGAQQRYDDRPDLTAMGKAIGGGFPVGAIAGRADVMDVMNPLAKTVRFPHSGTFSANPVTMTAGLTAMELFDAAQVERLNGLARRAVDGIEAAIAATGVAACVTGAGSLFRVHLKPQPPRNYREAWAGPEESARRARLLEHMLGEGFLMINTCAAALSTAMTEVEIDAFVAAMTRGFEALSSEA